MAAMFTDDSDELNKRYMPKEEGFIEDDDGEEIPEEELTEEERESLKMFEGWTTKDWQTLRELFLDEEDYTLSTEEFNAKNVLAKLNGNLNLPKDMIYPHKLSIAKMISPKQSFHIVQRLKKKPEEGANIQPEILDIIYAKAKEYKG